MKTRSNKNLEQVNKRTRPPAAVKKRTPPTSLYQERKENAESMRSLLEMMLRDELIPRAWAHHVARVSRSAIANAIKAKRITVVIEKIHGAELELLTMPTVLDVRPKRWYL